MARRGKRKLCEAQDTQKPIVNGKSQPQAFVETPAKRTNARREVFVRSLASAVTDGALISHFSETFPIKRGFIVKDGSNGQCKGYGFVTFADADDAAQAIERFQHSILAGRKIKLEVAESRHRDVDDTLPTEVATASGKNRSVPAPEAVAAKEKRKAELEAKKNENPPSRLIVRNLPWSVKTEADLEKLFISFGKVKQVILPKTGPGRLKGFGFVLLRGQKNAEKAMQQMSGKEVDGRVIAVDYAVKKDVWDAALEGVSAATNGEGQDHKFGRQDGLVSDAFLDAETSPPKPNLYNEEAAENEEVASESEESAFAHNDEEAMSELTEGSDVDEEVVKKLNREPSSQEETSPNTLFIRNLPYSTTDDRLRDHFLNFGPLRYARVVLDPDTERPRGTGFVCFIKPDDAKSCLKNAPRGDTSLNASSRSNALPLGQSVLQNDHVDSLGKYTLDGRVLHLARAVDKSQATSMANSKSTVRDQRTKDKRCLYLLNEGTIPTQSSLYESLSPAEKAMREASFKQRRASIQSSPTLYVSLTRLSIRNIPRTISSKALKELARQAVVGFASDVKAGTREKLSKEELNRGRDEMLEAEKQRKKKKSGIVKQAKVVFETVQGSKTDEQEGGGRSRGYGFIEYHTHRSALMGLRWLNGHAVGYSAKESQPSKKPSREDMQDRKRRLIVEFAIENAQVVHRNADREKRARDQACEPSKDPNKIAVGGSNVDKFAMNGVEEDLSAVKEVSCQPEKDSDKLRRRRQIIARKRAKRRNRNGLH